MIQKPDVFSILKNDSATASSMGGLIFTIAVTGIIYVTKALTGIVPANVNPLNFIWLTLAALIYSIIVIAVRVPYVTATFEHGVEVNAQILKSSVFRTAWTLHLRYIHLGQTHDVKLKQLITEKTKLMLEKKELALIVDQRNPKNILIRDVYL
ncbi:MAG TPA: hypothetical protein PKE35_04180 [Anaerolineales bacterium]|nr:hypothetical protein [Anaerolineales bacterium]HMX18039.1 hypothetical protein [Anaerolineales bacterium]HMX73424.1 hypothetical protein [Anaerolineales bacterium]HNH03723.1 hypothetical protein [Anaerolineales bacterium]HNO84837.1 hypothetical protein [Anaerolineales bacterium]